MRLTDVAVEAGAVDLFALKSLDGHDQLFNIGGVGRGDGWAGNLTLDPAAEPMLAKAVESGFASTRGTHPRRIFGPYWMSSAAVVRDGTCLIVFGGDELSSDRGLLGRLANEVCGLVGDISTTKRDADQAEIAQARSSVAALVRSGVTPAALARVAAEALGCEFAAVLSENDEVAIADLGWRPAADDAEMVAALFPLRRAAMNGFHVEQDAGVCDVAVRPLSRRDGVVSFAAASVVIGGVPSTLVVSHTGIRPRGFTDLCQEVLRAIVDEVA